MANAAYWYLVLTKPRQEKFALQNLEQQHYQCYLPMLSLKRRLSGRYQSTAEPMFSRYLFVRLCATEDNFSPIRSTRGVVGIVRFGYEMARVADEFIDVLQQSLEFTNDLRSGEPLFEVGDVVTILDGPFNGYEAIFKMEKGSDRAVILLDIVNTQLNIEKHALKKVS